MLSNGSATATLNLDKANLFNQYFASCFNPTRVYPSYSSLDTEDVDFMNPFDVVLAEVANLLRRTKAHCASGLDGISAWMLRSFADSLSPSIASMFNLSIRLGRLYQPCGRCPMLSQFPRNLQNKMSALIGQFPYCLRLLLEYLSSNNLLSNDQFGFRANRSTVIPLLLAIYQWHKILDNGKRTACVFFDLRKAFDSVPHQALLEQTF